MTLQQDISIVCDNAVAASRDLVTLSTRKKNAILQAMSDEIDSRRVAIHAANERDLEASKAAGLSAAMLDRLELTNARIDAMMEGLVNVARLKDPVGAQISRWIRPNGLEILKIRVPIGVVVIIYESRPNVTADAAGLCFKASNAVILRGGKEAKRSNAEIVDALCAGGARKGMPANAIQLIRSTDRHAIGELVRKTGQVDMVIPRGGAGLIRAVTEQSLVPVLKHFEGICHTYIDEAANLDMALNIAENAKVQRPGVCNAMETLLVHEAVADRFLPKFAKRMATAGVEMRGDPTSRTVVPEMEKATEEDWTTEYLDLTLAVRVVPSVTAAVDHINSFGSRHTDAIVSDDVAAQKQFVRDVDSSTVCVNASTRFADGGEFGMGAEIGISTDKLHARGPMGLEELTTYKYQVAGDGQIRE
jgi:glutamate-5-semialdehyde dehydrogenase